MLRSCHAVAFSTMLWLASTCAEAAPQGAPPAIAAPPSVAGEPLSADIVRKAGRLKAEAGSYEKAPLDGDLKTLGGFAGFETDIGKLSDLDMRGQLVLAQRGADGDLKRILKGISQEMSR